jgi:adenylate cyclase
MTDALEPSMPSVDTGFVRRERRGIVVVDLVESVRLFEHDELGTATRWREVVAAVEALLPDHGGRLVKSLGDGMLLEFDTIPGAAACALRIEALVHERARREPGLEALALRIGLHAADILVDRLDIYGTGVNLCARIASLAPPGGIVASAEARDLLVDALDATLEDLGECYVKHLPNPIRAYRLAPPDRRVVRPAPAQPDTGLHPVIAVFPFRMQPEDPKLALLGHVVADEINVALSPSRDLLVISRLSVMALADRSVDLDLCRRMLGVHYVVTGTVRAHGDRVAVLAELADARTRQVVWADSMRSTLGDILAGEGELVHALAGAVRGAILSTEVERARLQPLPTLESYSLLLGGIAMLHRSSRDDFQRSRALLETLGERHPKQSSIHAWIAKWHVLNVAQGWSADPADDTRRAMDATRRAIDLDDRNSVALAIDGLVNTSLLKRLDVGMARYEAAIDANPNDGLAWALKGTLHAFRGEGLPAVHGTRHALKLSPLDPLRYFYETLAATAELSACNYDDVIALAKRSLKGNRTHTSTWRSLAIAQAESGRLEDARRTVQELLKLDPDFTIARYRNWTPSIDFDTGRRWADALARAGVPA